MDNLDRFYARWVRVRKDPEVLALIRWYPALPGAQPFPTPHAFGSLAWETDDRLYPNDLLGEFDLKYEERKIQYPPGCQGTGTDTPLSWFRHGIPADVPLLPETNPHYPFALAISKATVAGVVTTPGYLDDEGALGLARDELPDVRTWEFLLFTWPPALTEFTQGGDLSEPTFPGYTRKKPVWAPPILAGAGTAILRGSPLTWTLTGEIAPTVVWGWAAVRPGLPVRIRQIALFPTPVPLAHPGDNVSIDPLTVSVSASAPPPLAYRQDGTGGVGALPSASQAPGYAQTGRAGVGSGGLSPEFGTGPIPTGSAVGMGGESGQHGGFTQVGTAGAGAGGLTAEVYGFVQTSSAGLGGGGLTAEVYGFVQTSSAGLGGGGLTAEGPGYRHTSTAGTGTGGHTIQGGDATPHTFARVAQAAVEVWAVDAPAARVSQVAVEVWAVDAPAARVSQVAVEVWALDAPAARVSQVAVEVWCQVP